MYLYKHAIFHKGFEKEGVSASVLDSKMCVYVCVNSSLQQKLKTPPPLTPLRPSPVVGQAKHDSAFPSGCHVLPSPPGGDKAARLNETATDAR